MDEIEEIRKLKKRSLLTDAEVLTFKRLLKTLPHKELYRLLNLKPFKDKVKPYIKTREHPA